MKIRSDYVSNSSSSSFIIDFSDRGACIDHQFMSLLRHFNGVTLRGTCETKEQCDELKERARSLFGLDCIEEWTDEDNLIWVNLDDENIDGESDAQIELVKDILSLADSSINCNGGDDYGSEAADAIKIATLLESRYKSIEISGDDHCDYTSIRGTDLDI